MVPPLISRLLGLVHLSPDHHRCRSLFDPRYGGERSDDLKVFCELSSRLPGTPLLGDLPRNVMARAGGSHWQSTAQRLIYVASHWREDR